MQQQWMVKSVEEFWQVIKSWRPKEGAALEARHRRRKGARMTVYRLLQVLRKVDLRCNWTSVPAFLAALVQRIRESAIKRAKLAEASKLSPETIKNIVADGHCPSAAPALLLAAFIDECLPDREPLSLVITTAPATAPGASGDRDSLSPTAGGTSPAADAASRGAQTDADGDRDSLAPTSGGTSPASDAASPAETQTVAGNDRPAGDASSGRSSEASGAPASASPKSGRRQHPRACDGLGRCRRRWSAARRRAMDRIQAVGRRSIASTAGQPPPESAADSTDHAPSAAGRQPQESPAATADRTPSTVIPDHRAQESPSTFPQSTEVDDYLSQESPLTFPRRTDVDNRSDRRNSPSSVLVDRQRVRQAIPPMHVMKCRFPDGRVMRFEASSTGELKGLLPRAIPSDDLIHVEIHIDGQSYDPTGLVAMERATRAEERAAKAEMKARELERSRLPRMLEHLAHGFFEQAEFTLQEKQQKQQKQQQKKEKRRHGRK